MISITRKQGQGFWIGKTRYVVFATDPHRVQLLTQSGMRTVARNDIMPIDGGDIRVTHSTPSRCTISINAPQYLVCRDEHVTGDAS